MKSLAELDAQIAALEKERVGRLVVPLAIIMHEYTHLTRLRNDTTMDLLDAMIQAMARMKAAAYEVIDREIVKPA